MKETLFDFFFAVMLVAIIAAVAGILTRSSEAETLTTGAEQCATAPIQTTVPGASHSEG